MPDWLDRDEYPFESRFFEQPMGRMHYIDEGEGDHAIVMVHGNPVWSFTFRHLIKGLSGSYRCIAPDHIGFGLSDKPVDWDYLPERHAENLEALLNHLAPRSITLVVGDWGGPIGLAYALKYPEKVRSVVITNTWMWSVKGVAYYEMFSRFMGSWVGRWLIKRFNFFVNILMKLMFRAEIPSEIHRHYAAPLGEPAERKGCWVFPREIIGSSEWLAGLWRQRDAIRDKPALILWGARDIAFRDIELNQWRELFSNAEVLRYDQVGHFVPEQLGPAMAPIIQNHLKRASSS